jgi:hypothetical protein
VGVLFLSGCGPREVPLRQGPEGQGYLATTEVWTREGVLYRGVETLLQARATLKSQEWRTAYATRVRELYVLTPQEHASLIEEMNERGLEIILALSAEDPGSANLMRTTTWSIFLQTGAQKLYPLSLNRLDWPEEKLRAFFPFYSPWQQFYLLSFPTPDASGGSLVIAGPGGRIDLPWNSF